jgi:DUF218 domain
VRLVLVFGYSRRSDPDGAAVGRARVARAAAIARAGDVVVLSGTPAEARAMVEAWGDPSAVVVDRAARRTVDTALLAAQLLASVPVSEAVVATSWWHVPRAWLLTRLVLPFGIRVRSAPAWGRPWPLVHVLREVPLLPLSPLQALLAAHVEPALAWR